MSHPKDTKPAATTTNPEAGGDVEKTPKDAVDGRGAGSTVGDSPGDSDEDEDGPRHLAPGFRVGRYIVLECVGEGSMGQVYGAYDPELDRKVALKILRVGGGTSRSSTSSHSGSEASRRRLMREAKALSQLAHPNVVAVHDVGTLDEEVFVAMEFVAGQDLRQWCQEKTRSWQEILEVYIQAGQGLAAAHAAGLVHRDFKPQNAVLGADGRVRVLDFGLATPRDSAKPGEGRSLLDLPIGRAGSDSGDWATVTFTRGRLGTPGYMAPEVIHGGSANEKSDQFSFSVALYQALYGCRPFPGQTLMEIAESIAASRIMETHQRKVPGWLRKALLRGLSADETRRFPSMEAMLTVLQRRDTASRRKRWIVRASLVTAATLVLAVGINQVATRNARLCQGAQRYMVDVWDARRVEDVRKALMATGVPYAEDTWSRVNVTLDAYARTWITMHQDACEATHVRGEQSGELLDLRMRCLKERLGEVKALVEVLSRADADVIQKAVPAANSLVPVSICADETVVRSTVPLPRDGATAQQVDELRQRLEHARALERTGKYTEGMEEVQQLEPRIRALGYTPLLAELLLLKGVLLSGRAKYTEAVTALEEADITASQAQHAVITGMVQQELVQVVGTQLLKFDEGLLRARYAHVILHQAGLFEKLGGGLLNAVGSLLVRKGEPEKAVEQQQRALELCIRSSAPGQCSTIMLALATANYFAAHLEEGARLYRETIALMEKTLGSTHPNLGRAMNNYGILLTEVAKYDEAMEWLQRARTVYEKSIGPEHPLTLDNLNNLGNLHWWKCEFEDARAYHQRALDIRTRTLGPSHFAVARSHMNLGNTYMEMGKLDLAQQNMERCVAIVAPVLGEDHERAMSCVATLGRIHVLQGRFDLAEPKLEKSVAVFTKALGPDHPMLYEPFMELGEVAQARRDYAKAASYLERSLKLQDSKRIVSRLTVLAHLRLAQVLWEIPDRRAQAIPHARQASEILARLNVNCSALSTEIAQWLETHKN